MRAVDGSARKLRRGSEVVVRNCRDSEEVEQSVGTQEGGCRRERRGEMRVDVTASGRCFDLSRRRSGKPCGLRNVQGQAGSLTVQAASRRLNDDEVVLRPFRTCSIADIRCL